MAFAFPQPLRADGRRWQLAAAAVLLIGVLLRLPGMFTDFWLDEIWALGLILPLPDWTAIFTSVHHQNNHYLQSLWIYALGDHAQWLWYRVPALAAGLATMALPAWSYFRGGRELADWLLVVLVALAYPLIHFSSEARGYALADLLVIACWLCLRAHLAQPSWRRLLVYQCLGLLGLLAHPTFFLALGVFGVWLLAAALAATPDRRQWGGIGLRLALWHLPTLACTAWIMLIDQRHAVGLATEVPVLTGTALALSWLSGLPWTTPAAYGVAAVALAVLLALVAVALRTRSAADGALAVATVAMPALMIVVMQPTYLAVRHWLVLWPFWLLLLAWVLAWLAQGVGWRRGLALLLGAWLLAANGWATLRFFQDGRGNYLSALDYLQHEASGDSVTISSDNDFRQTTLINYYRRYLPPSPRFEYVPRTDIGARRPAWVIVREAPPQPYWEPVPGLVYHWVATYPAYGLSGASWFLLRQEAPPAAAPGP